MESKEIRIKNRKGKPLFCRIDGIVSSKKLPAVLVVHGFRGDSTQRHIQGISQALNQKGILTLRVDLTKNPGKSYLEFSYMTYAQELLDIEDVFDGFAQIPEVDSERVGITGHSQGGMLVAELASRRKQAKSLVILSGVYDYKFVVERLFEKPYRQAIDEFNKQGFSTVWSKSLNKRFRINKPFYEDIATRTAEKFADKINCPTLVLSSGSDESVNQPHADKYLKNIASKVKKMEIINGSDHVYSGVVLDKVAKLVADWFVDTL